LFFPLQHSPAKGRCHFLQRIVEWHENVEMEKTNEIFIRRISYPLPSTSQFFGPEANHSLSKVWTLPFLGSKLWTLEGMENWEVIVLAAD